MIRSELVTVLLYRGLESILYLLPTSNSTPVAKNGG